MINRLITFTDYVSLKNQIFIIRHLSRMSYISVQTQNISDIVSKKVTQVYFKHCKAILKVKKIAA